MCIEILGDENLLFKVENPKLSFDVWNGWKLKQIRSMAVKRGDYLSQTS